MIEPAPVEPTLSPSLIDNDSPSLRPTPTVQTRPSFDDVSTEDLMKIVGIKNPHEQNLNGRAPSADVPPAEPVEEVAISEPEEPPAPKGIPTLSRHKVIKALLEGADPLDIPVNAKIEHKVNGLPVTYTVQDLLNKASGVDNLDRLYQDYQKKEQALRQYGNDLAKAMASEDPIKAIFQFVADCGHDPVPIVKNFRSKVIDGANKFSQMSDDQRALLETQEELEYRKNILAKQVEQEKVRTQQVEAGKQRAQIEQKYEMPEGAYDEVLQFLEGEAKAGRVNPQTVTFEDVGLFYRAAQDGQKVDNVIEKVAPSLREDPDVVKLLLDAVRTFQPTEEELEEVLKQQLGLDKKEEVKQAEDSSKPDQAVRNLSEKVLANGSQKLAQKSESRTETGSRKRPMEAW